MDYIVSGSEKQKLVTIERYQEIINWITADLKATTSSERVDVIVHEQNIGSKMVPCIAVTQTVVKHYGWQRR